MTRLDLTLLCAPEPGVGERSLAFATRRALAAHARDQATARTCEEETWALREGMAP